MGGGLRSQVCHEAETGLSPTGRCPWSNMCATARKSWDSGQEEHTAQHSQEMNLVRVTNCHSVEGELTISAVRLMDGLRRSLEVASSWTIREVGRFDSFHSYHMQNLTPVWSFSDTVRTQVASNRLKLSDNRYKKKNHFCMFLSKKSYILSLWLR